MDWLRPGQNPGLSTVRRYAIRHDALGLHGMVVFWRWQRAGRGDLSTTQHQAHFLHDIGP